MTHSSARSTRSKRSWTIRYLAPALACLLIAACSPTGASKSSGSKTLGADFPPATSGDIATLKIGLASGQGRYDVLLATSSAIVVNSYDALLAWNSKGELVPSLAKSWKETSPTTYVYELRDGVKFWDGTPLTTEDVIYSMNRNVDPAVASPYGVYYTAFDKVTATGPNEITVKLKRPDPYWRYASAIATTVIQKKFALAHAKDLGTPTAIPIGTGPYLPKSYSPASGGTLVQNPHYWGEKPAVQSLEFSVIPDPESRRLALQSGAIDATLDVPLEQAKTWDQIPNTRVAYGSGGNTKIFSFDTKSAPFNDIHLRRAIAHAIDREGIAKSVFNGTAKPARGVIPPEIFEVFFGKEETGKWYNSVPVYDYDLNKAKAELAKSKYPNGGLTIDMPFQASQTVDRDILATVQQNLKQLNIDLKYRSLPDTQYFAELYRHQKLGMQLFYFGATYPDPFTYTFYMMAKSQAVPNAFNFANFYTDESEKLMRVQETDPDLQKRVRAGADLVKLAAEDAAYIGINFLPFPIALNRKYTIDGEFSIWSFANWPTRVRIAGS
ncbi:ABC transporter substrate-binding protein [Kribbella solani]|uniref:ABC transporter substrate-binding protein n=1 Tax=Kribbella solani TaxID=236067 RepID=UPI0029B670E0|nr:ABC transporter substrate-binding protein [Kribbella solani]MDX2968883.1 ABC transporter substrate-binding protein [Kribbella solani]MDX3002681.1 ABC transporter substrate-binding protein [Kribbella solani]